MAGRAEPAHPPRRRLGPHPAPLVVPGPLGAAVAAEILLAKGAEEAAAREGRILPQNAAGPAALVTEPSVLIAAGVVTAAGPGAQGHHVPAAPPPRPSSQALELYKLDAR